MGKKSKRQVRKSRAIKSSIPQEQLASVRSSSLGVEFNPDYTSVIKDLKRIGILAGSFFFILVVLSFFLR